MDDARFEIFPAAAPGLEEVLAEEAAAMLEGLLVPADAAYVKTMSGALAKLTGAASGS